MLGDPLEERKLRWPTAVAVISFLAIAAWLILFAAYIELASL